MDLLIDHCHSDHDDDDACTGLCMVMLPNCQDKWTRPRASDNDNDAHVSADDAAG